jgi:hypothetical protein
VYKQRSGFSAANEPLDYSYVVPEVILWSFISLRITFMYIDPFTFTTKLGDIGHVDETTIPGGIKLHAQIPSSKRRSMQT